MIIVLKDFTPATEVTDIIEHIEENLHLKVELLKGRDDLALGIEGEINDDKISSISQFPQVHTVEEMRKPFRKASRQVSTKDSVIEVGGVKIGGGNFAMIGGPCSIETEDQLDEIAGYVKKSGGNMLRGGAFKPRTSPYSFQGLGKKGLDMMNRVGNKHSMPIVSEVMSIDQIELFDNVDMFQVGARNMQNFDLLKALGKTDKPILLKRGLSATIQEWLMSAEYIMSEGNKNVILCERGIRTFETQTRNTQDLSSIGVVKDLSHLPVVIDPSHAAGRRDLIESLSLAAVAAGADGLIIETHPDPENAASDGQQTITPEQWEDVSTKVWKLHEFMGTL